MSPSHTNKLGVRYRYYVSHAILQQRRDEVGSVGRVPAVEIEKLVLEAIRSHLASEGEAEGACAIADRDLIERRVHKVTVKPRGLELSLFAMDRAADDIGVPGTDESHPGNLPMTVITLPWTAPGFVAVKEIIHLPSRKKARTEARDPGCAAHRHCQGQTMDQRPPARPDCILRRDRPARRPGRTPHSFAGSPGFRVSPDHLCDR